MDPSPKMGHLNTKHGRQVTVEKSLSGNIALTSKSAQNLQQYNVTFYEWTENRKVAFSFMFGNRSYIPTVNKSKLELIIAQLNDPMILEDPGSCFTWASEDKGDWYRLESLAEPGMMLVIKDEKLFLQDWKTSSQHENADSFLFNKTFPKV